MKPRRKVDRWTVAPGASALAWGMLLIWGTATALAAGAPAVSARALLRAGPGPAGVLGTSTLLAVAGDQNSGVVCGEGAVFYSQPEHRNWWEAAGFDTTLAYTAIIFPEASHQYVMTANDGSIWRSVVPGDPTGSVFENVARPTTTALRGLCRIEGNAMIAVGDGGQILKCPDLTGASWIGQSSPTTANLHAVAWNGTTSVIAVGEGGTMLRAGSPGEDWAVIDTLGEARTFNGVLCNGNHEFLAFGAGGMMWKGLPDGTTWVPLESPTSTDLHGGTMVGLKTVVVGDGGAIYLSPGGFASWELASSPTNVDLYAAYFTGADVLACGGRSTILWSFMGETWVPTTVPVVESSWGGLKYRYRGGR